MCDQTEQSDDPGEHITFLVRREVEQRELAAAWLDLVIHEHDLTQARFADQARQLAESDARTRRLAQRAADLEAQVTHLQSQIHDQGLALARLESLLAASAVESTGTPPVSRGLRDRLRALARLPGHR